MSKDNSTTLNVSLYENHLIQEKENYVAKVRFIGTRNNEAIAREIVTRRSEFRYETILNILNICDEVKRESLAAGYMVTDGVSHMRPTITGCFKGEKAQFDPAVHSLHVSLSQSQALRKTMEAAKVSILGIATTGPVVNRVFDVYSATENGILTPGRNLKIEGENLRIAGTDPTVTGVWFVSVSDPGQRTPVDDRDMTENAPSLLTVITPPLTPGEYLLEVVTQSTANSQILAKTPRTFRFEAILTVE